MPKPHPDFDLIVVGASFAGLVAARTAAMRGLKVAIVEAKPSAGARVATTGILVKEAAEELDLPHGLTRRVHGVRLYAPNLASIDLFAPGYFFLTTRTGALLDWLAGDALRAGVRLYFGHRFQSGHRRADGLVALDGLDLTCRYLIGADGARSRVARTFGLGRNERFLTGVEAEYTCLSKADPRFLHCFVDRRLAPGYLAWVAPGPAVTQVGLATNGSVKPDLDRFRAKTQGIFGFADGRVLERRSGRIPVGGPVEPFAGPGVLLIGDAAGQVSPATGGGIRLAFHFGRRAGQLVADHLQHMGPAPELTIARELPSFLGKRLLRLGLDLAPPNALVDRVLGTWPARLLAQRVYFHRRRSSRMGFAEFSRLIEERMPDLRPGGPSGRLGLDGEGMDRPG
jgi:flavin-dependent dehydrogenase